MTERSQTERAEPAQGAPVEERSGAKRWEGSRTVVAETAAMLERTFGEGIDLRVALAQDLGRVEADRSQLEQVIVNLALNARDAMADGGTITIATPTSSWTSGLPPGITARVSAPMSS